MEGVLLNQKHASFNNVQLEPGEIILIQQTMSSLQSPTQKSIRWVMNYVETYPDTSNESDSIWGQHWNYIIKGENLRPIFGFNISDIQVSDKNYGPAVTLARVLAMDEHEVLNWIEETVTLDNENIDLAVEFDQNGPRDINDIIEIINNRYVGNPQYRRKITNAITRPTSLKNAIVKRDGTKCKICGNEGFSKKTGERYCELHHMIELNSLAPNTLQSWNVLIVCPTCHRQLHYGNVTSSYLTNGWSIIIDGKEHLIN